MSSRFCLLISRHRLFLKKNYYKQYSRAVRAFMKGKHVGRDRDICENKWNIIIQLFYKYGHFSEKILSVKILQVLQLYLSNLVFRRHFCFAKGLLLSAFQCCKYFKLFLNHYLNKNAVY